MPSCLSTYLLPIYLLTCLHPNPCTYLVIYLHATYQSTYLPTYQSTYLPTYQSTYLPICLLIYMPVYLPTCLSTNIPITNCTSCTGYILHTSFKQKWIKLRCDDSLLRRPVSKIDSVRHLLYLLGKTSKWTADNLQTVSQLSSFALGITGYSLLIAW